MGAQQCFSVGLGVFDDGYVPLVYCSEIYEEHMQAPRPAVGLLMGSLDMDVRCGLLEEWRCDIESRVQLVECDVHHVGRRGWPKVERIIAVVGVVVGDEGGEVDIVVYFEDRDGIV